MRNFTILAVVFILGLQNLNAQELVPRFYWADVFDTVSIELIDMPKLRQAIDSIDFTEVSEADKDYLHEKILNYERRWKVKYGNKPYQGLAATNIFIGGLSLGNCQNMIDYIQSLAEAIEGVDKATVKLKEDLLEFTYYDEYQLAITDKVVNQLRKDLEGCGFRIYNLADAQLKEVKDLVRKDSIFFVESNGQGIDCK